MDTEELTESKHSAGDAGCQTLAEAALDLANCGVAVFPLIPRRKEPLADAAPHGHRDATDKPRAVRAWWAQYPDANIGIATGERSGIVAVDIDGPDGRESASRFTLAPTLTVVTGRPDGGNQLYYQWPDHELKGFNDGRIGKGLDLRGDGNYVVAVPSIHPSLNPYRYHNTDRFDRTKIAALPAELAKAIEEAAKRGTVGPAFGAPMTEGGRDVYLISIAGSMRRKQASYREILSALRIRNEERCKPPLPDSQVEKIAKSAAIMASADDLLTFPDTDAGNAERLVILHGDTIRYGYAGRTFYAFDGKRWAEDDSGHSERLALDTVRNFGIAAALMPNGTPNEIVIRKDKIDFALKSENKRRQLDMLDSVKKLIPVRPEDFDTDRYILNCPNGTVNLQTGTRLNHAPADMLTKMTAAEYHADAALPEWDAFIDHLTAGDAEVADFLQQAVGYSLTGETKEDKLFFVHGPAGTGKSTFIEAIKATFSGYGATADFETFLKRHNVGGPREDVARLEGARLVTSVEVDEGKRLAEGLVKTITGGDEITARHLYQKAREFHPHFKLWLVANHAPKVNHEDGAMWRRIVVIPMVNEVPEAEQDTTLKRRLSDPSYAGPAILAWAVKGCIKWQAAGKLIVPPQLRKATEEYRASQDAIEQFIGDVCERDAEATEESAVLYSLWVEWCRHKRGIEAGSKKAFGMKLEAKGFAAVYRVRTGQGRGRRGLRINAEERD